MTPFRPAVSAYIISPARANSLRSGPFYGSAGSEYGIAQDLEAPPADMGPAGAL